MWNDISYTHHKQHLIDTEMIDGWMDREAKMSTITTDAGLQRLVSLYELEGTDGN